MTGKKYIVVAGWGSYPRLLIEGAKKAGVERMDCVAIKGSTDRATWKAADNVYFSDANGHDSVINVWVNDENVVTEIDWSTYTG